jgi:hypothetical protein
VNEHKTTSASPAESAAPPTAPTSRRSPYVNYRKLRVFPKTPIVPPEPRAEPPPPPAKVIDESLEDDDMKVEIGVSVFRRTEKLADFNVDRTIYGGAQPQSRETLLQELDNLLEEVHQSVACKVNRKLRPVDTEGKAGKETAPRPTNSARSPAPNDEEILLKEPIPLAPQGEEFQKLFAHLHNRSH